MEQGATLAGVDLPIGVVTDIAGATHATLRVVGRANHAGTTPMGERRDALAGAAELILEVERIAQTTPELVATVGRLAISPGAQNVVPGVVEATLDTRSPDDVKRHMLIEELSTRAEALGAKRGLEISVSVHSDIPTARLDRDIVQTLSNAIETVTGRSYSLPSWAVHDAQSCVAAGIPTGMVFVRSTHGSHNPDESVEPSDAAVGVKAVIHALHALNTGRGGKRSSASPARDAEVGVHAE
jgi:allantoate deiminase